MKAKNQSNKSLWQYRQDNKKRKQKKTNLIKAQEKRQGNKK